MRTMFVTSEKKENTRHAINVVFERPYKGVRRYDDVTAATKERINKLVLNPKFLNFTEITEDDGVELAIWLNPEAAQ